MSFSNLLQRCEARGFSCLHARVLKGNHSGKNVYVCVRESVGANLSTAQGSLHQREGELGGQGDCAVETAGCPPPADPFPVPTLEVY